jgi:hypothetical protein
MSARVTPPFDHVRKESTLLPLLISFGLVEKSVSFCTFFAVNFQNMERAFRFTKRFRPGQMGGI